MKRAQQWITAGLSVLFGIAILCYSFCHRFSPEKVTRAIPTPYRALSSQAASMDQLALIPEISHLPQADYFLETLLPELDKEYVSLSKETAISPLPSYIGAPSWVSATWVGGRSPWLRWKFDQTKNSKVSPIKNETTWPMWQCMRSDLPEKMNLYFALTENLFLVCLSETPENMVSVLSSYDRKPSKDHP